MFKKVGKNDANKISVKLVGRPAAFILFIDENMNNTDSLHTSNSGHLLMPQYG